MSFEAADLQGAEPRIDDTVVPRGHDLNLLLTTSGLLGSDRTGLSRRSTPGP
jgi:hypothetical protein